MGRVLNAEVSQKNVRGWGYRHCHLVSYRAKNTDFKKKKKKKRLHNFQRENTSCEKDEKTSPKICSVLGEADFLSTLKYTSKAPYRSSG